ncbi:MAG TPA: pseudouridine synthase [Gammaproteobacteria bacterium]|nr:pseudouridine synthase [Gammaproteobacteria bacterium]
MSHPPAERLQKLLSAAGLGSRREIEGWIRAGRVTVNSQPAQLGDKATAADRIQVDGRPVRLNAETAPQRVIAYHKPEGEITTRDDPEGRPTVFGSLPRLRRARWISIGRLDVNTSGLLLFTTDGELAHRLMHPSTELTRRYAVRVLGEVEEEVLAQLRKGVQLDDGLAQAASVEAAGGSGANRWYHLTLREGRNREVRRMWESQGLTVSRLIRIGYGPIELGRSLPRGKWRELTAGEMKALYTSAGLRPPQAEPVEPTRKRKPGGDRKRRPSATGSRRSRR